MSEAMSYPIPADASNTSFALPIGICVDYRAARQPEELFKGLSSLPKKSPPQFKNTDESCNYIVGISKTETEQTISVLEVVGNRFCVGSADGRRLQLSIKNALMQGKKVYLSFRGITNISAAFLDEAIGQLYNGDLSYEIIKYNILLRDISPERIFLVRRAIEEAKEFFRDPMHFQTAIDSLAAEGELD